MTGSDKFDLPDCEIRPYLSVFKFTVFSLSAFIVGFDPVEFES
jgi:hypothetical protein